MLFSMITLLPVALGFVTRQATKISTLNIKSHSFSQLQSEWKAIKTMKSSQPPAPVDNMGAESLASYGGASGKTFRFQALLATMLSPQTRDLQTYRAFKNLVDLVQPKNLTASTLNCFSAEEIQEAIKPASFYAVKSKNIKDACSRCVENFDDDIPHRIDDLFSFKGVGPKVGYLTFSIAWGVHEGICVDTHVHRISNRLGWVENTASGGPEKTRKELEKILPREMWGEVNTLLVGFGQTICSAKAPKCNICSLMPSCSFYNQQQPS